MIFEFFFSFFKSTTSLFIHPRFSVNSITLLYGKLLSQYTVIIKLSLHCQVHTWDGDLSLLFILLWIKSVNQTFTLDTRINLDKSQTSEFLFVSLKY